MSFYLSLTPYYDAIFPTNEKALSFIASQFKKGASLLDAGAGTGNMAVSLAKQGFQLTAMEPEGVMAEQIRSKAESGHLPIAVTTKTMQQLDELEGSFDGIYCIGNTLVHLHDEQEIRSFFKQVFQKLNNGGRFIFQIVNYDKVLKSRDFTFPVMEKDSFTFMREYELDGDHILFTTSISQNGSTIKNTIPLYPATSKRLLSLLQDCGFKTVSMYGNFESKEYSSLQSPALIVSAVKPS